MTEHFYFRNKRSKDGFGGKCKECLGSTFQHRHHAPEGLKRCCICKEDLPIGMFHKNRSNKDGLGKECKDCKSIAFKKWREQNLDKMAALHKKWRKNNPQKELMIYYRHLLSKNNLEATLTSSQWEEIKMAFNNKCAYCGEEAPLQKEHFVPLSKGGVFTHNNIIPACGPCNRAKHDRYFEEWYPFYQHYSKKREKFILSYLGYVGDIQQLSLMH